MQTAPPYSAFAEIYDQSMSAVPYQNWAAEILRIFRKHRLATTDYILDLGCGTGELTRLLQPLYPRLCGVDISPAMLQRAQQKKIHPLLLADLRCLPLQKASIAAAICTHDVINYLGNVETLEQHFTEVAFVLKDGGLYLFDSSTERHVVRNYHGREFRERHGNVELNWRNHYDPQSRIITSTLLFRHDTKLLCEEHRQNIFSVQEIRKALARAGLKLAEEFADYRCKSRLPKLMCYLAYK